MKVSLTTIALAMILFGSLKPFVRMHEAKTEDVDFFAC